jgi:ribosomal protein L40E
VYHRLLHAGYIKLPENIKAGPSIPFVKKMRATKIRTCKCGAVKDGGAKLCRPCYTLSLRKVAERPSKEHLLQLLKDHSYLAAGRMYGVSDNAIRKWLRSTSD